MALEFKQVAFGRIQVDGEQQGIIGELISTDNVWAFHPEGCGRAEWREPFLDNAKDRIEETFGEPLVGSWEQDRG